MPQKYTAPHRFCALCGEHIPAHVIGVPHGKTWVHESCERWEYAMCGRDPITSEAHAAWRAELDWETFRYPVAKKRGPRITATCPRILYTAICDVCGHVEEFGASSSKDARARLFGMGWRIWRKRKLRCPRCAHWEVPERMPHGWNNWQAYWKKRREGEAAQAQAALEAAQDSAPPPEGEGAEGKTSTGGD
jgi:hypothetical protein